MSQSETPSKPCHNCRRQRLRCDRSYPHCNKCAVASRGKLAGRTSSAPVPPTGLGGGEAALSKVAPSSSSDSHKHDKSWPSTPESIDCPQTPPVGGDHSPDNMQLVTSRATSVEAELKTPYILIDPLYQDLGESHRYYLSYFSNRLCKDLVSQDVPSENPFRSLLPLTKAHPLLQYIIVAASAAHMSNLVKAPLPSIQEDRMIAFNREYASRKALQDALVAKHKALRLMHTAVQDLDATGGDVALAAALFFVNVELIESGKHGWRAHLEGAGRIMSLLQPSSASDNALRDYMLSDCFIYFILGSAFMPIKFQIASYFEASQMSAILDRAAANSYMCCPPTILQILHGASQLSNMQDDTASPAEIEALGLTLMQQAHSFDVAGWANDARTVSYLRGIPIASRIHAGSAHRLAACLYILQVVPAVGAAVGAEFTKALSRDIFEHLASIPDDDPNFKATTWPTFIVGAEAEDEEQRKWILDRLQRLVVNCPWGFLYTAMETLQVIWGLDKEKGSRSWIQTLKDPDMNFLLVSYTSPTCAVGVATIASRNFERETTTAKMRPASYVLPCAASTRVADRFSVLDDTYEDSHGSVPFWPLLQTLLSRDIRTWADLLDLLETIAVTAHGNSGVAGDYGSLRLAVEDEPSFFTDVWPSISRFARALPGYFPSGNIQRLLPGQAKCLSKSQCASLLAHQFLCSLQPPRDEFYDFSVWYDSNQRHPVAVSAYLKSLFLYFRVRGAQQADDRHIAKVEYKLWSAGTTASLEANVESSEDRWKATKLSKLEIIALQAHSTKFHELDQLGKDSAVVVSANKDIGFGQSATQEELHLGAAPETCIAVLFTPRLGDDEVLSINRAQPMIRFEGQRRNISWTAHDPPVDGGRLLLMDALEIDVAAGELDSEDLLPDLQENNMTREITKAYTAFTSWPQNVDSEIFTGQWGCGAFNGDPTVKMMLLWIAASLAGRTLTVVLDEGEAEFGLSFRKLTEPMTSYSVSDVMSILRQVPKHTKRLGVSSWIRDAGIPTQIEGA
ncbi:hypothetical protein NLG97_g2408 [Lecanicillium saksenae]|uniref:Uncharacterized protein n=1 Tax=Lecanicillium saksenae TaxID=468837 RepID=A0ACC1R519_9HYPO|nr:hypothetical protein NLG97_g2408 [Lecanicillium saksenae]